MYRSNSFYVLEFLRAAMPRIISYGTVFFQFFFAGWIILSGAWLAKQPVWLILETVGLTLGVWAIFAMGIANFNITPEVKRGGRFVARGPYSVIRHPMYAAVLLTTLALVADQPTVWRWLLWGALLSTLLIKLSYEEALLKRQYPEYAAYCRRTRRLIPFLFLVG